MVLTTNQTLCIFRDETEISAIQPSQLSNQIKIALVEDVCLFLSRLPLEIRQKIYRVLLKRPIAIFPGYEAKGFEQFYSSISSTCKQPPIYHYQWDHYQKLAGLPLQGASSSVLGVSSRTIPISFHKIANPTLAQLEMIEKGEFKVTKVAQDGGFVTHDTLPKVWDEDSGFWLTPHVYRRGDFPIQLVNYGVIDIAPITGLALLRTCKQISEEVLEILYGENTFVLDAMDQTQNCDDYRHFMNTFKPCGDRADFYDELKPSSKKLPMQKHLKELFSPTKWGSLDRTCNSLIEFLRMIGSRNAARLMSIVFQGSFLQLYSGGRGSARAVLVQGGGCSVLEVFSALLEHVSPNLRSIAIRHNMNDPPSNLTLKLPTKEMVDRMLKKVVGHIPNLQTLSLELGGGEGPPSLGFKRENEQVWGSGYRWETIVKERAVQRSIEGRDEEGNKLKRARMQDYLDEREEGNEAYATQKMQRKIIN